MSEIKIDKVSFVYRNLNKGKLSSESHSSRRRIPDIERSPPDAFAETSQTANKSLVIPITPLQHWGLVVFFTNAINNDTHAKLIEGTIENGKLKGYYKDWDNDEQMSWRSKPGFVENEDCLDGGKVLYDEDKLKEYIQKFNDKNNKYDATFNNCHSFRENILGQLNLRHLSRPDPFERSFIKLGLFLFSVVMNFVCIYGSFYSQILKTVKTFSTIEKLVFRRNVDE